MRRLLVLVFALAACRTSAPAVRLPAPSVAADARPSGGCRQPQTPVTGLRHLTSGARTRAFLLTVPEGPGPHPLVLNFHGLLESSSLQRWYSDMDGAALRRGMIVAYPQGVGNSWNAGSCCGRARAEDVDDVRFARDLVGELESELCVDRARIYATGLSNGGIFSYRLACEASDLFAAIAPVAAVEAVPQCAPKRPVPVLAFHGTGDLIVTWKGGWFDLQAPEKTVAAWKARDRCAADEKVYAAGDVSCTGAPGCGVMLCQVEGGGHTWPGARPIYFLGSTTRDIDATATMLDFFLQHPMP